MGRPKKEDKSKRNTFTLNDAAQKIIDSDAIKNKSKFVSEAIIVKIEHTYTTDIVCPNCGRVERDSWEFDDSGDHECSVCYKSFSYERIITTEYSTKSI